VVDDGRSESLVAVDVQRWTGNATEIEVKRARDEEIVALPHACRSARDRLIALLTDRVGLRGRHRLRLLRRQIQPPSRDRARPP
jgi:hypothetical protein